MRRLWISDLDAANANHTYAFDWQPNSIKWYVDWAIKTYCDKPNSDNTRKDHDELVEWYGCR
ncbi:family 16 glycosylhydrolase [Bacillus halotolerans]|uniref:family 16 glycosylhydrolase n=1 Tax=Bacillus halotolerans TaxID=260554 RepID=UPI00374E0423